MPDLLVGAGSRHVRRMQVNGREDWKDLVTLDINADHKPNVVWDLTQRPLPFDDDTFDEVHAYDVLEHLSQQGNYRSFFDEWSEWWRILKPSGIMAAISPFHTSSWAWQDPGHTRVYGDQLLTFLSQRIYNDDVGKTPRTDYRFCYKADFEVIYQSVDEDQQFYYALAAVKPSRYQQVSE